MKIQGNPHVTFSIHAINYWLKFYLHLDAPLTTIVTGKVLQPGRGSAEEIEVENF